MYNLTFHAGGLTLRFNSNGNVDMEYDLKLWVWQGLVPELHDVGRFNGSLWIDSPKIRWHTSNNQKPVSQCSRQCQEGQVRRVKGFHSCCYDCVDCKAGSYRKSPGEPPSWQWGWKRSRGGSCYVLALRPEPTGDKASTQRPSPPLSQMTSPAPFAARKSGPRSGAHAASAAGFGS